MDFEKHMQRVRHSPLNISLQQDIGLKRFQIKTILLSRLIHIKHS